MFLCIVLYLYTIQYNVLVHNHHRFLLSSLRISSISANMSSSSSSKISSSLRGVARDSVVELVEGAASSAAFRSSNSFSKSSSSSLMMGRGYILYIILVYWGNDGIICITRRKFIVSYKVLTKKTQNNWRSLIESENWYFDQRS